MLHIPGFMKFRNLHEISQVEETTVKEIDNWKASCRDSVLLKISNRAPIQDGWPTDPITTEIAARVSGDNVLTILCYFLAAIPSLKVS